MVHSPEIETEIVTETEHRGQEIDSVVQDDKKEEVGADVVQGKEFCVFCCFHPQTKNYASLCSVYTID